MDIKQLVYESTLYIHDNYSEPISVTDISVQAYLSPSYFATVFRVLTGLTVMNYLNRYRLHCAATELVTSDKRIIEIAFESGYAMNDEQIRTEYPTFNKYADIEVYGKDFEGEKSVMYIYAPVIKK